MDTEKVIEISHYDIKVGPGGILLYNNKPVIDVEELPDGRFVMLYCDTNEVPFPESPKIIWGLPIIE